jgi:hypothetical protein
VIPAEARSQSQSTRPSHASEGTVGWAETTGKPEKYYRDISAFPVAWALSLAASATSKTSGNRSKHDKFCHSRGAIGKSAGHWISNPIPCVDSRGFSGRL